MHLVERTFFCPRGGSSLGKDSAGLVLRVSWLLALALGLAWVYGLWRGLAWSVGDLDEFEDFT